MNTDDNQKRQGGGGAGVSSPARLFEIKPLVVVAVLATLALGFAELASAVMEGETRAFDERVLRALRSPSDLADPIGPPWFEEMVRDVTALGSTFVLTFVVVVGAAYLLASDRPQKAAFLVAAVSLGALLNRLLKFGFARPRPDVVAHGMHVSTESFPSGHSANSAIVYLVLGMMLARVEADYRLKAFIFFVCVLVSVMVGMSRIYLGVHYPTDVLAGWTVGALWALLCWYALVRIQPSGTRR